MESSSLFSNILGGFDFPTFLLDRCVGLKTESPFYNIVMFINIGDDEEEKYRDAVQGLLVKYAVQEYDLSSSRKPFLQTINIIPDFKFSHLEDKNVGKIISLDLLKGHEKEFVEVKEHAVLLHKLKNGT